MKRLLVVAGVVLAVGGLLAAAAPSHKLTRAKTLPKGIPAKVAATLDAAGYQVGGPKGPVCGVWLVKDVPVKTGFKPTLSVKYPFTPGQLLGVLVVTAKSGYTDFRGQEVKPGVYTLRYGQQPEDGNHVGTSELADFLLAIPAKVDNDPKLIPSFDDLVEKSAKASGSTHPAIFSMLPAPKLIKTAGLSHDEDHDFWILNLPTRAKAKNKPVTVNLRFIAIGKAEE